MEITPPTLRRLLLLASSLLLAASSYSTAATPVPSTQQADQFKAVVAGSLLAMEQMKQIAVQQTLSPEQKQSIAKSLAQAQQDMNDLASQYALGKLSAQQALEGFQSKRLAWFADLKSTIGQETFDRVFLKFSETKALLFPKNETDERLQALTVAIKQLGVDAETERRAILIVVSAGRALVNNDTNRALGGISYDDYRDRVRTELKNMGDQLEETLPSDQRKRVWELASQELAKRRGQTTQPMP